MVLGQLHKISSTIYAHYSATIARIRYIDYLADNEDSNRATSTFLNFATNALYVSRPQKVSFSLEESLCECSSWLSRESLILNDQLMELVPKVISALGPTVAIIDREEGTTGPHINLLEFGLNNVENDADPVLVVVADHALMSVRSVCHDHSIFLRCKLSRVVLRLELQYLLVLHLHVLFPLLHGHLHSSVVDDSVRVGIIIFNGFLLQDRHFVCLLLLYQFPKVVDSLR